MNFLAHLFLSGENEEHKFGNFIADWVKGKQIYQYPKGIQNGILIHRLIDTYTDCHQITYLSKEIIRPLYGKYSGVLIDVLYDHFLAKNWEKFAYLDLSTFASQTYLLFLKKYLYLPAKIRFFLPHFIFSNRLMHYQTLEGFQNSIQIMELRTSLPKENEQVMKIITQNYSILEKHFLDFFPDLQNHISKFDFK